MDRLSLSRHKGMLLLFTDISQTLPEESITLFERNRALVAEQKPKPKSIYSLVDATGARFNSKLIQTIKDTAKQNNPFVQSTVVVGLSPVTKAIVNSIIFFTGRDIKILDTAEQGREFLFEQFTKASANSRMSA